MGIPIGDGFDFFVSGQENPTYRMKLEAVDVDDESVLVSVARVDGDTKKYSLAVGGSALYFRRGFESPLDIRLQSIRCGRRGDILADFNFYSAGVYSWRKLDKES